ncbi:MAG: hypothetical protein OEY10_00205 [Nitrosopumilus sp.]|nr:hypothetical protein [Nitrosopumilus sp.]
MSETNTVDAGMLKNVITKLLKELESIKPNYIGDKYVNRVPRTTVEELKALLAYLKNHIYEDDGK